MRDEMLRMWNEGTWGRVKSGGFRVQGMKVEGGGFRVED